MAIPKAYQTQMQADIVQERAENAAGDRAHIATKRVKSKARKRINLRKKRKYFWLGLIYMIFLCFIKWTIWVVIGQIYS